MLNDLKKGRKGGEVKKFDDRFRKTLYVRIKCTIDEAIREEQCAFYDRKIKKCQRNLKKLEGKRRMYAMSDIEEVVDDNVIERKEEERGEGVGREENVKLVINEIVKSDVKIQNDVHETNSISPSTVNALLLKRQEDDIRFLKMLITKSIEDNDQEEEQEEEKEEEEQEEEEQEEEEQEEEEQEEEEQEEEDEQEEEEEEEEEEEAEEEEAEEEEAEDEEEEEEEAEDEEEEEEEAEDEEEEEEEEEEEVKEEEVKEEEEKEEEGEGKEGGNNNFAYVTMFEDT